LLALFSIVVVALVLPEVSLGWRLGHCELWRVAEWICVMKGTCGEVCPSVYL